MGDVQPHATRGQRLGVGQAVLLPVEHDEIGGQVDDRIDVRILRASDVTQLRLLAEARAGDDVDTPGEQRLGDRRDEADDPQEPRSRCFCAWNSSGVSVPRCIIPSSFSNWAATSTLGGGGGANEPSPPAALGPE